VIQPTPDFSVQKAIVGDALQVQWILSLWEGIVPFPTKYNGLFQNNFENNREQRETGIIPE